MRLMVKSESIATPRVELTELVRMAAGGAMDETWLCVGEKLHNGWGRVV